MEWHDIRDPNDPELDRLAERYGLHPLQIEDCRHRNQVAKVEDDGRYLFVVLKPVEISAQGDVEFSDLDLFLGRDFLITVQESACEPMRQILDQLNTSEKQHQGSESHQRRADELFYRIADAVVDAYLPALDYFDELGEELDREVLEDPTVQCLDRIFSAKRSLIELRRVLANTRDVALHLQRTENVIIGRDLWPFLRDIYDHVARNLDTVEVQRDLLSGAMEIYLSSQAQRTNQVMKVLTIFGTIALPALVVSGIFGMNLHGLPWADSPFGSWYAVGTMAASTVALLALLHRMKWL